MKYFRTRIVSVAATVLLTVILDQYVKHLALEHLQGHPDVGYFGGLFTLTFARNTGAFLSMGSDLGPVLRTIFLEVFPAALLIALLVYIFREKFLNRWQVIALALIVGGGLSNIVDRLYLGHVVDMFHMQAFGLETGIFNVADMAIMAGMFIMLPFAFRNPEKEAKEDAPVAEA